SVLQVAPRDESPIGMRGQPALAVAKQLVDFGVAHPVMLLVVEDGNEHVQMREQAGEPLCATQRQREVATGAPLWRASVQCVRRYRHGVAERLEQSAEEHLAASARNDREPS